MTIISTAALMTRQQEYVKQGGRQCPVCKINSITAVTDFESDTQEAWRLIRCNNCGSSWEEVFQLRGYEIVSTGDKNESKTRSNEAAQLSNRWMPTSWNKD